MTLTKAARLDRMEHGAPRRGGPRQTFPIDLLGLFRRQMEEAAGIRWPAVQFQRRYVDFAKQIIGLKPWRRQEDLLRACEEHDRVACKSGHKCGKSTSAAIVSLCDYASFPDMRVIITAPEYQRQVKESIWRSIGMLHAASGRCIVCASEDPEARKIHRPCPHSKCIDGDMPIEATTGLRSHDHRQIFGFAAKEALKATGLSGRHMRWIFDEAPGIDDAIFDAVEGNMAGGALVLELGNPVRSSGHFREIFRKQIYYCVTISSEETPNCTGDGPYVPGLADPEWIEQRKKDWGEDNPLYISKVKGEFAELVEGQLFPPDMITAAEERWSDTEADGRLFIGIDPARKGADETVWCLRRGKKVFDLIAMRGLTEDEILQHTLGLVDEHRIEREIPAVVLDREGDVGAAVHGVFRGHLSQSPVFQLAGVRSSEFARMNTGYHTIRDEMAGNLRTWFREEGAIPSDLQLQAELALMALEDDRRGRTKLTPKDFIKSKLKRSPDRYDALALSVYEPASLRDPMPVAGQAGQGQPRPVASQPMPVQSRPSGGIGTRSRSSDGFDPYSGRRRR